MKKYKAKYPSYKTTRPIAINSIYSKIMEHILHQRTKDTIAEITSINNSGFKPGMSTELQLLRIQMRIEENMNKGEPSYILAMDIKGGYNNVNLDHLDKTFE